eukprot:CAMPEP_0179025076 /NCGR_PEP_ID=MMETSP0796-20121207/7790_1 /TAXON_ID=73915 /ORGANISM="Pyrodinium bahamense, Strain pbaha01" /LENGTH=248 /DNA_ID=CAMNT_0020721069 /DNA_START=60 /DNA_END=806 /DNA_ORIENTATION=+
MCMSSLVLWVSLVFLPTPCAGVGIPEWLPEWLRPAHQQMQARKERMKLAEPVLDLTGENFEEELNRTGRPIVVAFVVKWCPYCKRIGPAFEDMAWRFNQTLRIGIVDFEAYPELRKGFAKGGLPLIFFVQRSSTGRSVVKFFGPRRRDVVETWISLKSGAGPVELPFAWRVALMAYHIAVSLLAQLLTALDIEPTDSGSAGGPLDDGGTLGVAALVVAAISLVLILVPLICCCCCRAPRGKPGAKKKQ